MARGNGVDIMEENLDSSNAAWIPDNSDAAWIKEVQRNIRAASVWMPPWENRKRAREEWKTRPSIFRVPASLRGQIPEHHQPKVVAIGPYHRGNSELLIKDEVKRGCVNYFVSQHSLDLQNWLLDMMSREQEARMYYSDDVSMDRHSFLEMLLLDGCFIFMAFKAIYSLTFDPEWPSDQIMLDLLMLENQIPFFVLVQLYDGIGGEQAFRKSAGRFAGTIISFALDSLDQTDMIRVLDPPILPEQVLHLLHLFRVSLYPAGVKLTHAVDHMVIDFILRTPTIVPSATELQDRSAMKFEMSDADSFPDIRFHDGVMKIPFLEINDGVKTILHNLIAFEQCYYPLIEPHVTTYAEFMDCLVNKESDANLLERSGILLNRLPTSKDAAFFFSKLSPRAKLRSTYLRDVTVNVNRHHNSKLNRWYADLKLNYFSNPWVSLSVVAAVVFLFLNFTQSYYSVISYYNHK